MAGSTAFLPHVECGPRTSTRLAQRDPAGMSDSPGTVVRVATVELDPSFKVTLTVERA